MKVFILCNTDILATNSIYYLHQTNQLAGIGITDTHATHLQQLFTAMGIPTEQIYVFRKNQLLDQLLRLKHAHTIDCIITMTFPWKIPATFLQQTSCPCINFHFGLLPAYRGADPIFWQLRNQETHGGITVHHLSDSIDAGDILHTEKIPIHTGETYGMHSIRLAMLAENLLQHITELLNQTAIPQKATERTAYAKAPSANQLQIQWQTDSASAILALIHATNPKYHGAITQLQQQTVRVLEANLVPVTTAESFAPGTIVHADAANGLVVACKDQAFIGLQALHVKEGFLTGFKLYSLGVAIGQQFV